MDSVPQDIMQQLRQEIMLRQGFRPPTAATIDMGLGPVTESFPQRVFPAGAMHEMLSEGPEGAAASAAFAAALMGRLMARGGACIWIGKGRTIFPPGLSVFGLEPDRILFVRVRTEKELLWVLEESLKCEGLAAVAGEIREISPIASRRLQLAVEQSRVTGFLLRDSPRNRNPIAAVARWRITPAASEPGGLPGVGHWRWNIELEKIRNGQPGSWILEWRAGQFRPIGPPIHALPMERQLQTG
jgi:protein ImuA